MGDTAEVNRFLCWRKKIKGATDSEICCRSTDLARATGLHYAINWFMNSVNSYLSVLPISKKVGDFIKSQDTPTRL